jgi:RNA polymerase sigma-70 factor (ECF subfamily)
MEIPVFNQTYLERLRQGDPETEHHFSCYFGDLLSIKLRQRIRSPQLLQDAKQETFLRVLTAVRRDAVAQPERLGAFVNSVCNNVLFEMFRSEGRVRLMPQDPPEFPDPAPSAEATLARTEQGQVVRSMLESLPDRDRELLRQVFFEERDKDAVCQDFGVSRDYLRVLLHRARNRFRNILPGATYANL